MHKSFPSRTFLSRYFLMVLKQTKSPMRLLPNAILVVSIALSITNQGLSLMLSERGNPHQFGPANNAVHDVAALKEGSVCNGGSTQLPRACSLKCCEI